MERGEIQDVFGIGPFLLTGRGCQISKKTDRKIKAKEKVVGSPQNIVSNKFLNSYLWASCSTSVVGGKESITFCNWNIFKNS